MSVGINDLTKACNLPVRTSTNWLDTTMPDGVLTSCLFFLPKITVVTNKRGSNQRTGVKAEPERRKHMMEI